MPRAGTHRVDSIFSDVTMTASRRWVRSLLIVGTFCTFSCAFSAAAAAPLSCCIFAPQETDDSLHALNRMLLGARSEVKVTRASTLADLIASPADVLVIVSETIDLKNLGDYSVD